MTDGPVPVPPLPSPPGALARGARPRVVEDDAVAPPGWDERTVRAEGGHLLQGRNWAAHRAAQGWEPRFVGFDDGRAALVLLRRRPFGAAAYCPRGPVAAGDPPGLVAARLVALADHLRRHGVAILAADPVLDADPGFEAAVVGAGFHAIEEIQAGRHRLVVEIPAGASEEELLARCTRSTRQRIRGALEAGTTVGPTTDAGDLDRFAGLLRATAERLAFGIGSPAALVGWWRRLLDAGDGILLVARNRGRIAGGLLCYRQGGHLATAYSADDPALRADLKGTMHLLRWSAILRAREAGAPCMDLGAVDVPGARRRPEPGEPTYGLYEHKLSLGARWVECAPAHEIVLRPAAARAGRLAAALLGVVRRR